MSSPDSDFNVTFEQEDGSQTPKLSRSTIALNLAWLLCFCAACALFVRCNGRLTPMQFVPQWLAVQCCAPCYVLYRLLFIGYCSNKDKAY